MNLTTLTQPGTEKTRPIVLIHGAAQASWIWRDVATALRIERRIVLVDLPGHGRNAHLPAAQSVEAAASAVARALAAEFGAETFDIVGFSVGAQIAIQLASVHPEIVATVTVISAEIGARPMRATVDSAAMAVAQNLPAGARTVLSRVGGTPKTMHEDAARTMLSLAPSTMKRMWRMTHEYALPAAWARVRVPALILVGSAEAAIEKASARQLAAALPSATLKVVPGARHNIPVRHAPALVQILRSHLGLDRLQAVSVSQH